MAAAGKTCLLLLAYGVLVRGAGSDEATTGTTTLPGMENARWVQSNVTCLEWGLGDAELNHSVRSAEAKSVEECRMQCEGRPGCLSVHWFQSTQECFMFHEPCADNATTYPIADWMTRLVGNNSAWTLVESVAAADDVLAPAARVNSTLPMCLLAIMLAAVAAYLACTSRVPDRGSPALPSSAPSKHGYVPLPCDSEEEELFAVAPDTSPCHAVLSPCGTEEAIDARPPDDMPPASWQRVRSLGRGSFGTVYLAVRGDGSLLAVKVVRLPRHLQDAQLRAVAREVQVLAALDHPAIVKSLGCRYDPGAGELSLFMPYLPGGSLAGLVRNMAQPLREATAVRYVRQALEGLAYIHERGVIHCDIKGDNILLDASGAAKLADFGAASFLPNAPGATDDEAPTQRVGTPLWMAPEVIAKGPHTTKSDVWAVGITTVEALNRGATPWGVLEGGALQAVYHISQWAGPLPGPAMPESLSPACREFLLHCHRRDPDERLGAAELLRTAWLQGGAGGAPCATPPPLIESARDLHRVYQPHYGTSPTDAIDLITLGSTPEMSPVSWDEGASPIAASL